MTSNRQRALILGLIAIGLVFAGFFGLRALHAFREFKERRPPPLSVSEAQPIETDVELVRDWMTIGYLSYAYRLPPRLLYKALGIPPAGNEEKSLVQLNEEYYPHQPGFVLDRVKTAIQMHLPVDSGAPTTSP